MTTTTVKEYGGNIHPDNVLILVDDLEEAQAEIKRLKSLLMEAWEEIGQLKFQAQK